MPMVSSLFFERIKSCFNESSSAENANKWMETNPNMKKEDLDINAAINLLNKKSGLLGISGLSNDMREIIKERCRNKKAELALDLFSYRIKKYIGAYAGIMGGCDAVVFTGGIGENQPDIMKDICKGVLSKRAKMLIIPTDEELMIARDTYNLVK